LDAADWTFFRFRRQSGVSFVRNDDGPGALDRSTLQTGKNQHLVGVKNSTGLNRQTRQRRTLRADSTLKSRCGTGFSVCGLEENVNFFGCSQNKLAAPETMGGWKAFFDRGNCVAAGFPGTLRFFRVNGCFFGQFHAFHIKWDFVASSLLKSEGNFSRISLYGTEGDNRPKNPFQFPLTNSWSGRRIRTSSPSKDENREREPITSGLNNPVSIGFRAASADVLPVCREFHNLSALAWNATRLEKYRLSMVDSGLGESGRPERFQGV